MSDSWKVDATKILDQQEILAVLGDVTRRAKRSLNSRQNLIIFRLSCCCGLRVSEICGLRLGDVRLGTQRPNLRLPKAITKGHKARRVPLWWDRGTLADLESWKALREAEGAGPADLFVCARSSGKKGQRLDRRNARKRFLSACRALGTDRTKELTIHHGRHSFCSHAIARGRTLTEVRDAAGHSSVGITSVYLHVPTDGDNGRDDLFEFNQ